MRNCEEKSTSVREANGQDQTTHEHVTVTSVSLAALLNRSKQNFVQGILKHPLKKLFGTDSYRLGIGTSIFGTRFHHH